MHASFVSRVRFLAIAVALVALVLVVRLYDVQIAHGEDYAQKADRQYLSAGSRLFDRGDILMTPKEGPEIAAAMLDSGFVLAMNPTLLKNPADAYTRLSAVISISESDFLTKAGKTDDSYEELAHRVSSSTASGIEKLNIDGLMLYRERWRVYPGNALAAQTIGFLGYGEGDVRIGQYGLERYYEDVLSRANANLYVNFFAEIFSGLSAAVFDRGEAQEGDIVTALEPTVQLRLEQELARYLSDWRPKVAGGIVMDPSDGRILAIGVLPSFNLNDFSEADPRTFKNPLVENVYELGSIMKPITMAAGLDSGAVTADTTYYDKGYAIYDGSRINNFDLKGRGTVPMQEVLNQSLNTGVAYVATTMGTKRFAEYLERFGITQETGIDLPGEAAPLTDNLESPRTIEYATASFGQGVALSPVAMTRALAVLGNGGVLVTPHIATEIRYPSGRRKELGWSPRERVISEASSEEITRMLVTVVDTALRGGTKKIEGYSIAAKTGTAQIAREGARGYYEDRFLHSFFGYFPAYDSRFLIFLFAVEPQGARYASETLTEPFFDMTKFLITYYDIPPDRPVSGR